MFNFLKNKGSLSLKIIFFTSAILLGMLFAYLYCLPRLVSNPNMISSLQNEVKKQFGIDLIIQNPELKTSVLPVICFKIDDFKLLKDNKKILEIKKLNTKLSFNEIFLKRIKIKRLSVDEFYTDVNGLLAICPTQETQQKKQKKCNWHIDIMDALLYAKNVQVYYDIDQNTKLKILSKGFGTNNAKKENRRVYFNIYVDVTKNGETLSVFLKDQEKVIIDKKTLYINDLPIQINNSKILLNGKANRKIKYDITAYSKKFEVKDIVDLIESDLLMPGGKELLSYTASDIDGKFDFDINFKKGKLKGQANIYPIKFNFVPICGLPVTITEGSVDLDNSKIILKDFKGHYLNESEANKITFKGTIKDYMKTMQMDIEGNTFLTDSLAKNYLSKLVGFNLGFVGDAATKIFIKSKNFKFDILGFSRLAPGEDILVENLSLTPKNYERIIKADMHFEDMLLNIKGIDYFIGTMKDAEKGFKRKSIMALFGNYDCANYKILDMGINIPDPLPSEFFNLFAGPKFFRKGFVSGKIHYVDNGKYPVLEADMLAKDIRIPSQRLKINEAKIKTDNNNIHVNAFGKYKRSDYNFNGYIRNNLTLPIIVKNVNLSVDYIDIDRLLQSFNMQNTSAVNNQPIVENENLDDDVANNAFVFDTGLLIVEDCNLKLAKANYNDINMGNLHAILTLDKDGVLKLNSNKFDFAEGISSVKVNCDLMNHKYYVKLGVKDVNSDLIAGSLLGLKKEISGKAKGIIELNSDASLKMNGQIKFAIENGAIGKVGLLEYVLKFASLFRNPLAMISPSTLSDLVTIPDGSFDDINGELYLKDNNIELIKIKSRAPLLSSFIVGCFNLETRDAILRIYTKMSNKNTGFYGFMRNISLNALANRIPLGSTNEVNYYSNELKQLPSIDADDKDCQIFLTKVDGDVERNNFISSLKRIR